MEIVNQPQQSSTEDKTVAILAYIGLIGFIIAIVLHGNKKTRIGAFHLRQALGLMITGVGTVIVYFILIFIPVIGWLCIPLISLGMLALLIIGIVNAAGGKFTPLPIFGELYNKMFGSAFE